MGIKKGGSTEQIASGKDKINRGRGLIKKVRKRQRYVVCTKDMSFAGGWGV